MMNRVVITGMGIYSTIGKNLDEVRNSLYTGRSGIGLDLRRKEFGFRSCISGVIERPNLNSALPERYKKMANIPYA